MITSQHPPTREYELIELLTGNSCVALEHEHGILTLLIDGHIEKQALLTPLEVKVLDAMLKSYPNYCSHAELLAVSSGRTLEECREEVSIALEDNALEWLMRPTRNILVRVRAKTRPMGIEIKSVFETGYMLVSWKRKGMRNTL